MTLSSAVCSLVAALTVVVLALNAHRHERDNDMFVLGCDRFGYEQMARVIREARDTGSAPDFSLHDEQTRWLVGKFKEASLPVPVWDEAVTTHAHHYFPGSDQVGPQYPPGTGWILSMFPAANDVKALDRLTILLVTAGALGFVAWCAWRGLTASGLVLAGAVAAATRPRGAVPAWRAWLAAHYGLVAAPLCAAGLSTAYFLTHVVTIFYYLVPAMLLTGLLLGLLFVALETHWQETAGDFVAAGTLRTGVAIAAVAAALPAAVLGQRMVGHLVRAAVETRDDPPPTLAVPAALLEPRAWVWADLYSSSILYYTGHPAFKISFASPETRRLLYGWIAARGDPQYLVADSDQIKPLVAEARAGGWRLSPVGEVRDAVCYRMDAP